MPVSAIRAVYTTETGGNTFFKDGKVKILFERHYFHNATGGAYDKTNPDISNKTRGGYGKFSIHHDKLKKAISLNEEAAYYSTSFGGFQIMGANYEAAGYKSATEFGKEMLKGNEDRHLEAFVNLVGNDKVLTKSLKN